MGSWWSVVYVFVYCLARVERDRGEKLEILCSAWPDLVWDLISGEILSFLLHSHNALPSPSSHELLNSTCRKCRHNRGHYGQCDT
ncbi:hypothetical protein SADUNF_Sadunf06G0210800 [Salix dunnii]|uniref:Uncharacterized protein n=1 Tax=Salix dunnii TaxID=1413687 RepID=A0A835K2S5_9ROSI|nr:hypothetical protein SADUNF_Sadunf06G0210800 [Salix dunnii]